MIGLGLDIASDVLERLGFNSKWGKKRLKKDPFTVCKIFGHAEELFWQASDQYWQIADSPEPDFETDETNYMAYKSALNQAEADYQMCRALRDIRAETRGLKRRAGLTR